MHKISVKFTVARWQHVLKLLASDKSPDASIIAEWILDALETFALKNPPKEG